MEAVEKYGIFKDMGTYKTLLLDECSPFDEFEYYFESLEIPKKFANKYYKYKITEKDGKRAFIDINGWKSGSCFTSNSQWYPDHMFAEIADPKGEIREVSINARHPYLISAMINEIINLSSNYTDWRTHDLAQENEELKNENVRLLKEIVGLKNMNNI